MSTVGEANVIIRPVVQDFRGQVAAAVNANLRATTVPLPISPELPRGSRISWESLATGAAVPKVIPLPVQPTITPAGKAAFGAEVGGLRGVLLGGGQFAASRALGISGLAAGLFVFGKAAIGAVKSAATLEQELNVFQQVSGATADQMARVREEARRLGADISLPAVSAGDAAATMTELAKAGLSVDEVLKGTRGTLQLSTAANLDFATSAELAAGALNAFELPGTQAIKIADLLAGAANAAQGDIGDFGLALTQAGAVAHQAGLSVQETVTFLTELAKAGIQGSDAGTSLRVALLRLIAPTSEAKAIFKELGIEITDASGNVRVDVFEQLRQSMEALNPATRNAALATIFGTDAIRSAAIFTREGAKGFEEMARQVGRAGQAQEAADARTKGLSGSVSGLVSNADTLGTTLGSLALGPLTILTDKLSEGVTGANELSNALINLGKKVADTDLGPFGKIGDIITDSVKQAIVAGSNLPAATAPIDLARGRFRKAAEDITATFLPAIDLAGKAINKLRDDTSQPIGPLRVVAPPGGSPLDNLIQGTFTKTGEDVRNASLAGQNIGTAFSKGVGSGIDASANDPVAAARRTVSRAQQAMRQVVAEGQKAIAETIRQGSVAVEAAAVEAKQNLTSIGQTLATQVIDLIDTGPLAQQIERLQARLDRSRTGLERGRLRTDLRDARRELEQAETALAGGPPKTTAQRAGEAEFLEPFKNKVKDAQAALEEFNTQGNIDKLRARLEAQKARLQKTLDDLIARFNAGLLSAPQVNARVAALLQRNVGPMGKAGEAQGFAFRQAFASEVEGLQAQLAAIIGGPRTRKTGVEPTIVKPADVAAQARADLRDARAQASDRTVAATRNVKDAVIALNKAQTTALTGPNGTNEILRDIRRQLGGQGNAKPSSTAKPRSDRGTRTGGR